MRLNQKAAIVTGAGSGMGQAEALGFAKEGAQVVVADVNLATAEATRDAIVAAGGKANALAVDVTQLADLQHLVDVTLATYGRIDVLVNNAGIFDYYTASLDTSEALWDKIFAINVKSMFQLSNLVLPHMQAQQHGAIINICSIAGLVANMGGAAYTASKHAVAGYTKHLAAVYGKDGIKINAICPGTIRTAMTAEMLKTRPTDKIPLDRFGEVGEVVDLAVFLASDEARFMNGALVPIDGGFTIV